jgi:hypothetical protein
MKKEERLQALKALAEQKPYYEPFGIWKNPLNPKSRGMRWRGDEVEIFKKFQIEARQQMAGGESSGCVMM